MGPKQRIKNEITDRAKVHVLFVFFPIFHLPVNRAVWTSIVVLLSSQLIYCFFCRCRFLASSPSSSSLLKLPISLLFTISAPFAPNSLKMFSV